MSVTPQLMVGMSAGVRHTSGANSAVQCCGTPIGVQQDIAPTAALGVAASVTGTIQVLITMEKMDEPGGQNLRFPMAETSIGKRTEQFLRSIGQNTNMKNGFPTNLQKDNRPACLRAGRLNS